MTNTVSTIMTMKVKLDILDIVFETTFIAF